MAGQPATQSLAAIPVWLQRIVLPAVVAIGRVLGKYPPCGWPGAPGSCLGAPEGEVERTKELKRTAGG